jgi:KDO2-lipid IV(A) lauroyltransferase
VSKAGDILGYGAYKAVSLAFALLPRRLCLAAGAGLGRLAFRIDRRHRGIAIGNLTIAFGKDRPPEELNDIARGSFVRFGQVIADVLKMTHYSRSRILSLVTIEGAENIKAARAKGKGVLAFTAHFGNWELANAAISEAGPLRPIARVLDNLYIERDLRRFRTSMGAEVIDKFGASRPILRALHRNEIVGILIDQNVLRSEAVFVDFFGKAAATTPGLAVFHLATGAPIVPVFTYPAPGRRYLLRCLPPLEFEAGGRRDEDVLKITQICTKMIEHEIRSHPEEWLWIHKRWNTRPAEEVSS